MGYFVQLDRCNAGVRLTIREGVDQRGATVATLVRQPHFTDAGWKDARDSWLGRQSIFADSEVRAWKDHRLLGNVDDLVAGRIDETGDHG